MGWGGREHFIAGRAGSEEGEVCRYFEEWVRSLSIEGVGDGETEAVEVGDSDRERFGMVRWRRCVGGNFTCLAPSVQS